MINQNQSADESRLLRLSQILGDPSKGLQAVVPISRSAWWDGVKSGRFPSPVKIGPRAVAWRERDICDFLSGLDGVSS